MRIVVILLLLVPVILLKARDQDPADGAPDLQIGEFSTSKFIAYDYKGPIPRRTNSTKRRFATVTLSRTAVATCWTWKKVS
jgi:hypothetical protein